MKDLVIILGVLAIWLAGMWLHHWYRKGRHKKDDF